VGQAHLGCFIKCGLLCPRSAVGEWLLPGHEKVPAPRDGYVVAFAHFHECGFKVPPHPFFLGLHHHYKIELHHLNLKGIQHITAFIALCEGFLGIDPRFELWKYFFVVSLVKKRDGSTAPDRLRGNPFPRTSGPRVHGHHHHEVEQRVAFAVVLHQEPRRDPPFALHRSYDRGGFAGMVVGACGQGEEEARPTLGCHSVPEGPRPLRCRGHRSLHLRQVAMLMARVLSLFRMALGVRRIPRVRSAIRRSSSASGRRWTSPTRCSWSRGIQRCGLTPTSLIS
jgi:hypothetical protein